MNTKALIEASLTKKRVEKLIVCLGYTSSEAAASRRAVPSRVAQTLLQHCAPPRSDVLDSSTARVRARDAEGRARSYYGRHTQSLRQRGRKQELSLRAPQMWDSAPVVDYMGLWCDRLLLGDAQRPSRCAIIEPQAPQPLWGDALARVAQSHRHLKREDVLIVCASEELPFGLVRQSNFGWEAVSNNKKLNLNGGAAPSSNVLSESSMLLPGSTSVRHALQLFPSSTPASSSFALIVGIGDAAGLLESFTREESTQLSRLLPLCAFTAALWTVNPQKSAAYIAGITTTPQTLNRQTENHRLWRTMQSSMLSTRDTAVLTSYFTGVRLDARLSMEHTKYLAETLLSRLEGERSMS